MQELITKINIPTSVYLVTIRIIDDNSSLSISLFRDQCCCDDIVLVREIDNLSKNVICEIHGINDGDKYVDRLVDR